MCIFFLIKNNNHRLKEFIFSKITNIDIINHYNNIIIIHFPQLLWHIKNLYDIAKTLCILNKNTPLINRKIRYCLRYLTRESRNNTRIREDNTFFLFYNTLP